MGTTNPFAFNSFVALHDQDWLERQRVAGKVNAGALTLLENEVNGGTTKTLLELDRLVGTYIRDNGCEPTFYLYKGFPANCCMSTGQKLVHGIPNDYVLQEGDKVSFDLGCTFKSAISDSAITLIVGTPKSSAHVKLIKDTEDALTKGIESIAVGRQLGIIGSSIYRVAKDNGYGCIVNYGGHGLSWDTPHASPFVHNKSEPNEGIRITNGLCIAIEPMFTSGSTKTRVDKDGWTVWCDADMVSHCEHSIYIHDDHVEIITARN